MTDETNHQSRLDPVGALIARDFPSGTSYAVLVVTPDGTFYRAFHDGERDVTKEFGHIQSEIGKARAMAPYGTPKPK